MKKLFIVAGDPSGDLIASQLVESIKKIEPTTHVTGIGGENLKRVSDKFLGNIVGKHALGFAISPKVIMHFRKILNEVIKPELLANPPDVIIPVDFYGFNSLVAQMGKNLGHHVFYYVSPQFWASRPGRAEKLRPYVDLFLCLFPFEVEFYKKRNLPAKFVGHPILDKIPQVPSERAPRVEPVIGLLPGSRPEEIERHLPIMAEACQMIAREIKGTRFILFTVPNVSRDLYQKILKASPDRAYLIELVQDEDFKWRTQLDLAMTASGMETLENTVLGIPMVIMYKTNWPTYWIVKSLIKIPFIGMPNLLAGHQIVPEFIQGKATAEAIAQPLLHWLKNPSVSRQLRKDLLSLKQSLGDRGASERAARAILEQVA